MHRVLWLEDDPEEAYLIDAVLTDHNWVPLDVVRVETLEAAEAAISSQRFDLVVSDWKIQQSDGTRYGTDFLKRNWRLGRKVPSILVSSMKHVLLDEEILDMMKADLLVFMSKDELSPESMSQAIVQSLSRSIRVLLVEPDDVALMDIASQFRAEPFYRYEVHPVRYLRAAERQLHGGQFDVVLIATGAEPAALKKFLTHFDTQGTQMPGVLLYGDPVALKRQPELKGLLEQNGIQFCGRVPSALDDLPRMCVQARNEARTIDAPATQTDVVSRRA